MAKQNAPYKHVGGGIYEVKVRVKGKDAAKALVEGGANEPTDVDPKKVTVVANRLRTSANTVRTIVEAYLNG